MEVERIIVRLFADATPYTRAMREAERQLVEFAAVTSGVGRLLEVPLRAAAGAAIALGVAAIGTSYAAVKLAADFETVSIALEVMTGSAETGKKLLKEINDLAVETPFKSTGLQTAAKSLSAFGVEADEIIPTLRVLGDVASGVAGKNLDEMMGRVVLAFGQVKTAGRLMGPESRQFIEAGVPIYEYLAKVMDKPRTMIKGMIEDGKVGFPQVVRAFNLMTAEGGRFFNMMERQSQTVHGRWSAFVETLEIGLRNIGLAAFEGFGVKDTLDSFVKSMGDFGKQGPNNQLIQFFKDLKESAQNVLGIIRATVHWIEKAYRAVRDWVKENREIFESLGKVLGVIFGVIAAVEIIVFAVTTIYGTVMLLTTPLGQLLVTATLIASVLGGMGVIQDFGSQLVKSFDGIAEDLRVAFQAVKNAILAENYDALGRIVGLSFKIGFKMGVSGIEAELKLILVGIGEWFVKNLVKGLTFAINESLWEVERLIFGEEEATRNWKRRGKEFEDVNNSVRKVFDDFRNNIKKAADADLEGDLAPLRQELRNLASVLSGEAAAIRYRKSVGSLEADPEFQRLQNQMQNEMLKVFDAMTAVMGGPGAEAFFKDAIDKSIISKGGLNPLDILYKLLPDASNFPTQKAWEDFQKNDPRWRLMKQMEEISKKHGPDALMRSQMVPWDPSVTDPVLRRRMMQVPLTLSSEATRYAGENRREMAKELEKGIGFGAGQFSNFQKTMDIISEAEFGPLHKLMQTGHPLFMPLGAVLGSPLAEMSPKEAQFARFREFETLRRWTGVGQERLSPAAMEGSVEAMDIINRSSLQQVDKLEEIKQILKAAEILQAQQNKIMEETNAMLLEAQRRREAEMRGIDNG